jgi:hypothetical protein
MIGVLTTLDGLPLPVEECMTPIPTATDATESTQL